MAREHARAFSQVPGTVLVGLTSRSQEKAKILAAEFGIPAVYGSVEELFKNTEADLAVVTVSVLSMKAVALACFKYPWTVLLEKPPGCDLGEALDLRREADLKQRQVFVALNRRFYSATQTVLQDLKRYDGRRYVHVRDQQDIEEAARKGFPPLVLQKWMYANSIHTIDYLRMLSRGQVRSVTPITQGKLTLPCIVSALVEFDSGDIGMYEGTWNMPGPWAVSVTVSEKRWEMRPLEQAVFQDRGERSTNSVEVSEWDRHFKPGLRLQAEEALSAAMGKPSNSVTLNDAVETMRLVHSIYKS